MWTLPERALRCCHVKRTNYKCLQILWKKDCNFTESVEIWSDIWITLLQRSFTMHSNFWCIKYWRTCTLPLEECWKRKLRFLWWRWNLFQMCRTWTQESIQGFTLIQTVILQDKLSQIKVIRVIFNLCIQGEHKNSRNC
jgi:hypothetical protein